MYEDGSRLTQIFFYKIYLHQNEKIPYMADDGNTAVTPTHISIQFVSLHYVQMASDPVPLIVE
jgi:hypothetical protein